MFLVKSPDKRWLLLSMLFLWCTIAFSQEYISGSIKDEKGLPIPFASVTLCPDSVGVKGILSYSISDKEGCFRLNADRSDASWLIVKSLGYEVYSIRCSDIGGNRLAVVLKEQGYALSEVTVAGKYAGVKYTADSIVFDVNHFRTGSEETVGDVLKRLPGVDVSDVGKVSFAGRDVDKVLINGRDVAGSGTNMIINNTPADFVLGAEVLNNYKDGSVTDSFKNGEKTALNIKTTANARLSGTLSAGGGIEEKFDVKPSLFMVKDKLSLSAVLSLNNTGTPVFSIEDYLASFVDIEDMLAESGSIISLSDEENKMLLPPENVYKNTSWATALNITYDPTDKLKLKSSVVFNKSRQRSGFYNRDEYFGSGCFGEKEIDSSTDNNYFSTSLRSRWKPSENIETSASTLFSYSDYSTSESLSQTAGTMLNVLQTDDMHKFYFKQSLTANFAVGRNIVFCFANISVSNRDNPTSFDTDTLLLPLDYVDGDGMWQYGSTTKKRYLKLFAEAGNAHKFSNGLILKTSFGYDYVMDMLKYSDIDRDNRWTNTCSNYNGLQTIMRLSKDTGFFRFSASGRLSAGKYDTALPEVDNGMSIFFSPEASCRFVFSPKQELGLTASYVRRSKDIRFMLDYNTVSGYDKINMPSQVSNPYLNRLNASLNYRLFNMFDNFLLFIVGSYAKDGNSVLQDVTQQGIVSQVVFRDGGKQETASLKMAVSKGINIIPADLRLSISDSWIRYNSMINGEEFYISNNLFSSKTALLTRFKWPLNAEVSGGYEHISTRSYNGNTNDIDEWSLKAKLLYSWKQLKGNINFHYNHLINDYGLYTFADFGFSVNYSLQKFTLKLSAENILHLSGFEWVRVSTSNLFTSTSVYRKISGNLMLTVSYRI